MRTQKRAAWMLVGFMVAVGSVGLAIATGVVGINDHEQPQWTFVPEREGSR
jgi:hypothetical protein